MSEAVRAAQDAERAALAKLVEARRQIHLLLTSKIRQGASVPRELRDLVDTADITLADYNKAVTAARDAYHAWSQTRAAAEEHEEAEAAAAPADDGDDE